MIRRTDFQIIEISITNEKKMLLRTRHFSKIGIEYNIHIHPVLTTIDFRCLVNIWLQNHIENAFRIINLWHFNLHKVNSIKHLLHVCINDCLDIDWMIPFPTNVQMLSAFGAAIGMWVPSIAPSTLGKPAMEWKPTLVLVMSLSVLGNFMVFGPLHKAFITSSMDL